MKAQASPKRVRRESHALDFARAVLLALGVHVAAFGLLWLGSLSWEPKRSPTPPSFTLVDAAPFVEAEQAERDEQLAAAQAEEAQRRLEQARREEAERQAVLERERETERQEEQQRAEEQQSVLEQQRQQQLEREAEQQRRQAEQQRERDLDRERREAEQARLDELEDLRRQREAAQRDREEQERRLAEIAEEREEEEARRRAEAEAERLRLAREQAEAEERRGTLREDYVATIAEQVRRNWIRPSTTESGIRCRVRVVQIPSGVIIDQAIASPCNADQVTRESIISAVERTEQLTYEGYEDVFEREIDFIFRYDGD